PTEQGEDAVAPADPQLREDVGEPAGRGSQLCVRGLVGSALLAQPADGDPVAPRPGGVAVDGLVGDVQAPAAGQTVEAPASLLPGECRAGGVVVDDVGPHAPRPGSLADDRPGLG